MASQLLHRVAIESARADERQSFDWLRATLVTAEGESHQRLRQLVSAAFTQRGVDRLRPFMQAKAHELIDGFAAHGRCEFMSAFADPYPAWVIAELLGIPRDRFDAFLGWATDMALGFNPAAATLRDRIDAAVNGLCDCCEELIAQRRVRPGEDLISALIAARPMASASPARSCSQWSAAWCSRVRTPPATSWDWQ